jgi:hypothetical protein
MFVAFFVCFLESETDGLNTFVLSVDSDAEQYSPRGPGRNKSDKGGHNKCVKQMRILSRMVRRA